MAKKASAIKGRQSKERTSRGEAVSFFTVPTRGMVAWAGPASVVGPDRTRGGGPANISDMPSLEALGVSAGLLGGGPGPRRGVSPRGVLVVGLGDEDRGDGAVGLHLLHCLAQLDWPESVVFCEADESIPARAEGFARIILLEAIEGPEQPGSLYRADPKELLASAVGGPGSGLGLLTMLSPAVLERVSIFGVQPLNTSWGSELSADVIAAMPALISYLRARILKAASEARLAN